MITIQRTKHLTDSDLDRLTWDTSGFYKKFVENKLVIRSNHNTDSRKIEEFFTWLKETCQYYYHVKGPLDLKLQGGDMVYYIYFLDKNDAVAFKLFASDYIVEKPND